MARIVSGELFCTDEDVLIAAPGDFPELVPRWQQIAGGSDGAFAAQAGGSFTMTSAISNFAARGVVAGHIGQLTKPVTVFKSPDLLVVAAVAGNALTFRRAAQAAGEGTPPGPQAGLGNVEYLIATLYPQRERATYDIMRRLALDPNVPGRTYEDLYDPRELQAACLALVLWRQYRDMARTTLRYDDIPAKAEAHRRDYEDALARLTVHLKNGARPEQITYQVRLTR